MAVEKRRKAKLDALARRLHFGSPLKRKVFEALMGAEDYRDAVVRLQHLGLKKK